MLGTQAIEKFSAEHGDLLAQLPDEFRQRLLDSAQILDYDLKDTDGYGVEYEEKGEEYVGTWHTLVAFLATQAVEFFRASDQWIPVPRITRYTPPSFDVCWKIQRGNIVQDLVINIDDESLSYYGDFFYAEKEHASPISPIKGNRKLDSSCADIWEWLMKDSQRR